MTQAGLQSALPEVASYSTPQLQLVVLQIFAQLQHDRDIARSQYQMAKFQLSREEDRLRKEQARRLTIEHQLSEQVGSFQARTQATLETAAEVERLLEKAKEEATMALEQASRFKELSEKKDILLSRVKTDLKLLENSVQMSFKDTKVVQIVVESRKGHLQRALEESKEIEKKLLDTIERANYFQQLAEERELLITSSDGKLEATQRELQSAKDQIKDLQSAVLKASQNVSSCEAKLQMSVEEAINLKNLMKAEKELLAHSWVIGNTTLQRLQTALEQEKHTNQREEERTRNVTAEEKNRNKEKEAILLQEKQQLQRELELERNKSASLQFLLVQNVTAGFTNLSTVVANYCRSQEFCQKERLHLLQTLGDERRSCDERISTMSQKIVDTLQQLKNTTYANRQMSEQIKQKLLTYFESERNLTVSLQSSFSSNISAQIERLQTALQSHHFNMTMNLDKYIISSKESFKKLPYILNGRTMSEALIAAARNGNVTELEVLLDAGANIETYDDRYKETLLIWAAEYGKAEACRFLLERGANIRAKASNWGNRTPLHAAAVNNRMEVIKLLVEMGADLTVTDSDGKKPTEVGNEETKAWFRNRSG